MFQLSGLLLVGATATALEDDVALLQMPFVEKTLQSDQDDSECRCPGYFQTQCEAEAAQGCVWTDAGSSNKPWCQCQEPPGGSINVPVTLPPLPPVTAAPAPPVTEPVDDESFCAAQCQAAGNCCNDPSIGSNQQISCAQACMMRASGQRMDAMLSANGGICNRNGNSGCSLEVQGQSYSFCQSCQDLQEHCPHGVQSSDECDFGASLLPPSAVVDPEPVTAAPEPVTAAPAPVTVTPVTAAPEPVTAAPAPVTAAPEPASCPGGWLQVGESGADIGGCGLQPCDQRYQTTSEEQCASACDAMAGCQGFNYSPLNGDRNHETERVCTLYNSDTPTGSWSGTAGFVQVFCTRVSPPEVTEPPVALIPECESGGFMTGDGTGIGAHETYIGTASSPEVCVAMVHDQCPSANGATLPTSGDGGCYCEFAMTGVNSNSHWSSCQFAVPVAEPEPPVNTLSQCDGGSFLTGDGVGGHETNIGTAASAEECVAMVREQCPEANGATLPTSGSGGCYCEFGMTGVNTSPSWQSCNFLAPPEESPPPTTSIPECVGGTFLTGDGAGGHETNIGAASSPQECVAMVLEQCPGANGATLPAGGDGNCYCEFSMSSLNGNTHWQSCQFEEAARTLIDECNGGAYLIGDGTGGHETHIGSAATPEECVTMVHQQCPGANGATLPTSGSGGCYCEYGMTDVNSNQHWSSCHFAVPVVEPDQTQCAPPVDSTADAGYVDDYRGWYDVQGCGECNDYCRWVGNTGSLGDPSANFHLGQDGAGNPSWWSCRLAGTTDTYSARGLFTSFDFQKCAGQR